MELETLTIPMKMNTSSFNPAIAGVVAGITAAVGAMVGAIAITAKWANELDSIGDVMGGTNKQVAALAYVARVSGVGVDTLTKSSTYLEKGLVKANGQLDVVGNTLARYGVKVKDANGKVKDQATLVNEISKKYQTFATQQERINYLTDIYGKSGAKMVDFFDTLAQQGGIDAVTKKVEALGLAIDSGRYEQFNRNLEELKMAGTGIAVAFTEMVMPQLERFLGWFSASAPKVKKFVDKLLKAFQEGDYEKIGNMVGNKLSQLDTAVANRLNEINWTEAGKAFGEMIDKSLADGITSHQLPKSIQALGNGIKEFLIAAVGEDNLKAFKEHGLDYLELQLNIFGQKWKAGWAQMGWDTKVALNNIRSDIGTWEQGVNAKISEWGTGFKNIVKNTLSDLAINTENKLREIAKTFFDRALGWTQQAKAGFTSGLKGLLDVIGGIVDSVNSYLKKIITSFTISIKLPSWMGGGSSSPVSTGSGNGGGNPKKRASGGSVIAGQVYNVNELGKPEWFIPNTSGKIETKPSMANKPIELSDRTIRKLADELHIANLRTA